MFRIDFQPYMSLASRQAHGAQIFAAFSPAGIRRLLRSGPALRIHSC